MAALVVAVAYFAAAWLGKIAASAPVAAMVSMFAVRYGRDVDAAVAVVSGTTALSILTMPPVIALALSVL